VIFQAGMTQTETVNHFNCSKMTIYRLLVRVRATDTTSDRRRSGRPRETTLRQDRHFTLIHLRNRSVNAVDTARRTPGIRNNIISYQTVRNRLRQSGLRSYRPLKGMELKRRHRIARLQWARARLRWRRTTWQNILFSDQFKFNLKFSDGRVCIYRRRRERFADGCVKETDRFGGGGVMVWGGISHVGKTNLKRVVGNLNVIRYCDEILAPIVLPFI
jgi:transposase